MDRIFSPKSYCCVHRCRGKSSLKSAKDYELHKFPSKYASEGGKRLLFEWINAIKLPTKWTPGMRVCSQHFTDEDFIIKDGQKVLNSKAIPSKHLPPVWRNKFYPRNNGRLVKLLEYRGIGRLRLCLQAKLVKRVAARAAELDNQRKKSQQRIKASASAGKVIEAFSLSTGTNDLTSEVHIKEEPLSDQEDRTDTVEEMLAKMNEESPVANNNNSKTMMDDITFDEEIDDDDIENDFCLICGSDACTGHGGLQFDCTFCSKSFKTFRQLNAHNLSHFEYSKQDKEVGRTKCKVCGEILANERLSEHMAGHASSKSHVCMLCDRRLFSKAALMQHVNSEHTLDRNNERCRLCKKVFPTKTLMDAHVKAHQLTRKEYLCKECGVSFRSKSACWEHLNMHSRERMRPGFECEVCNRVLSTKATLKEHMFIHSGEKPFECLLCGKKIRHRANFIMHVQSHSLTSTGMQVCGSCGAQYQRKSELRAHQMQHHPQDVIWFPCIICGLSFKTEAGFVKHAISHDASLDEQ